MFKDQKIRKTLFVLYEMIKTNIYKFRAQNDMFLIFLGQALPFAPTNWAKPAYSWVGLFHGPKIRWAHFNFKLRLNKFKSHVETTLISDTLIDQLWMNWKLRLCKFLHSEGARLKCEHSILYFVLQTTHNFSLVKRLPKITRAKIDPIQS